MKTLEQKILEKEAEISIVGMGCVGFPLAVSFAEKGFNVIGYDKDENKVSRINAGQNILQEETWLTPKVEKVVNTGKLKASADLLKSGDSDFIIISVPTPAVGSNHIPDYSYVTSAIMNVSKLLRRGAMISLESTTGPGTTRELLADIIQRETKFRNPFDFGLVFSPERIDQGNPNYHVTNIPKVVGGLNKEQTKVASLLYQQIIPKVIELNNPEEAEFVKLLENVYRDVNIALANEFAMFFEQYYDNNFMELLEDCFKKAAGQTFYPGLVGGHCIPHDPWFLIYKLREKGIELNVTKTARQTNQEMPSYVVSRLNDLLTKVGKTLQGSKVTILGLAYKENVSDTRTSPGREIGRILMSCGAQVCAFDPYLDSDDTLKMCTSLQDAISGSDAILLVTSHKIFSSMDIPSYLDCVPGVIFYDIRQKYNPQDFSGEKVLFAGLGRAYSDKSGLSVDPKTLGSAISEAVSYVNVSLVREFSVACDIIGNANINSVIKAASSKPFGFSPFYPDDLIVPIRLNLLEDIVTDSDFKFRLIEAARSNYK